MKRFLFETGVSIILLFVLSNRSDSQIVWQQSSHNPVLAPSGNYVYLFEPYVLYDSINGYRMWCSSRFLGEDGIDISYASSADGLNWNLYPQNPVLTHGSGAAFDRRLQTPSVIYDGTQYKMYYTGANANDDTIQIGLATSPDGIAWTKYSGNPVVTVGEPGSWDSPVVAFCDVHFDGFQYVMWYSGNTGANTRIGRATSRDGIHWVKDPQNPVFTENASGGFDSYTVVAPRVVDVEGVHYLFYLGTAVSGCCDLSLGWAYSTDGTTWTRYAGNPVIPKGLRGSWDDWSLGNFDVAAINDTFHIWYSGYSYSTGEWQTGYATSPVVSIDSLPKLDPNVVALWHFDEGSGNILHDASMYHNDGQIHNCQWVPGKFGPALHFDGLTSYVVLPNSPSLQLVGQFTIEAWYSLDTLQFDYMSPPQEGGATLLCNYGPNYLTDGGYGLGFWSGAQEHFGYRSHSGVGHGTAEIPVPTAHLFHHTAVVYKTNVVGSDSSTVLKMYLDGVLRDSSACGVGVQYANTPSFYIGTEPLGRAVGGWAVREFPGILDEIRISKVALDPSQFDMPHGESLVALHVRDAGNGYAELQFGTMPGATDGLDTAFGEQELPPKPPKGDFDARWQIAGTLGSLLDLEDTLGGSRPQNEYAATAQPGPGGFPITLQWDPNSLPAGTFELVDQVSYGNGYMVNMRVQNSFVLSDTSPQPFVIVYNNTPAFVGGVFPAWNMISLPLTVPDRSVKTLFPMASSEAFGYQGGYVPVDSLAYGLGYWIKFDTVENISVSGSFITTDTVNVAAGWNMIGTVSAPMPVDGIVQIPANNVLSRYFTYQGGYQSAASLVPMRAYWVKVNSDGKLVLNESASNAVLRPAALRQDGAGLSRLDITDSKGNAGTLYVASRLEVGDRFDASQYVAPPAPPAGAFDARFGADQLAALYEVGRTGPQRYEIDIQAAAYPVKISWSFVHAGSAVFALLDAATGKEIGPNISGTGSVLVTNKSVNKLYFVVNAGVKADVPGQFALEQNYPNPFNPTTMVQYALPKDEFVTLKVYSLVGQEVAILVLGRQSAGYHTALWDASNVPSGVYFCHMAAGTYTAVRKMVLVK
ncbi:MAG: LamG-like jellyroll fold domain-containing protein [Bacteroidota bacterium]|jgi:predicted GH43/DUF377 family glycosyl hydrolase